MKTRSEKLPDFLRPFLWSYDLSQLDQEAHKKLIIFYVLNNGNSRATDWVRKRYTKEEISSVIRRTAKSEWSKKSLALWSLVFGVEPERERRIE